MTLSLIHIYSRHDYTFQSDELKLDYLDSLEFVKKCSSLRGSVLMIGPLLGRLSLIHICYGRGVKLIAVPTLELMAVPVLLGEHPEEEDALIVPMPVSYTHLHSSCCS